MENKAYSLNLAPMGKRLAAWLLDFILTITLAVGFMLLASVLVNYDKQVEKLNEYYDIHNVYRTDEKGNNSEIDVSTPELLYKWLVERKVN